MPDRLRPWSVTALSLWTLVVWTGRLGLAWGTDGSTASKVWATVPVVLFVVLGLVALVVVLRSRDGVLAAGERRVAAAIAWWTIAYWVVRLPVIWFDGRSVGFKGIHTVLAVLSWAAAAWAIAALRSARRPSGLTKPNTRSIVGG